jgi:hypothetical protein
MVEQEIRPVTVTEKRRKRTRRITIELDGDGPLREGDVEAPPTIEYIRRRLLLRGDAVADSEAPFPADPAAVLRQAFTYTEPDGSRKTVTGWDVWRFIRDYGDIILDPIEA